ncbi:MAG: SPOR domain-containing protein [Rhodocyclaceae bacterium]
MRVFVFLLVLVNLLFFVWTQGYLGSKAGPDSLRLQQQLLADQVNIVSRSEPPAASETAAVVEKPVEKAPEPPVDKTAGQAAGQALENQVCLLWNDLPLADADRFERLLAKKFAAFKPLRSVRAGSRNYWVFMPAQASRQDAERKTDELKRLGIADFFVVQDTGPHHLAISLGIFSTEGAASEHLEALRAKGVRTARVGERSSKPALASLEVSGPAAQSGALQQLFGVQFPQSRPVACKEAAAPAQ